MNPIQMCGMRALSAACGALLLSVAAFANSSGKALIVIAHPDDEYYFAATVFRMAVQLNWRVDELIITDGEAGYRYSTLAEPYYGKSLTIEAIGRKDLPEIRKKEALNAGRILGIKRNFFLDQKDERFTTTEGDGLRGWDSINITHKIAALVRKEHYQFIFSVLPRSTTHGEHQAATDLAATAIHELPEKIRPVLLGFDTDPSDFRPPEEAAHLQRWKLKPSYSFDRTRRFGFNNALNYQIIVDWMIAEHKSQGLLQTMCGKDPTEYAWIDLDSGGLQPQTVAESLFRALTLDSVQRSAQQ